ncbi:unnamed protein product [Phytomonas sp. Hart1]|nr:unnamed protein product [Phytomonas sp. Hart1]|eukprot:CCW67095.1 unnamed protein product [Phytomonas sp. isolate Hart1]
MPTSLDREIPPYRSMAGGRGANPIDLETSPGLRKRAYRTITRTSGDRSRTKEQAVKGTIAASQSLSKAIERFPDEPSALSAVKSNGSQSTRAFFSEGKNHHPEFNSKDDSFSEGYGSYESQEYLRGIGLLQRYEPH